MKIVVQSRKRIEKVIKSIEMNGNWLKMLKSIENNSSPWFKCIFSIAAMHAKSSKQIDVFCSTNRQCEVGQNNKTLISPIAIIQKQISIDGWWFWPKIWIHFISICYRTDAIQISLCTSHGRAVTIKRFPMKMEMNSV